ncbi:hypothetical protein MRX96_020189 [Rhipicephalus microplus]
MRRPTASSFPPPYDRLFKERPRFEQSRNEKATAAVGSGYCGRRDDPEGRLPPRCARALASAVTDLAAAALAKESLCCLPPPPLLCRDDGPTRSTWHARTTTQRGRQLAQEPSQTSTHRRSNNPRSLSDAKRGRR